VLCSSSVSNSGDSEMSIVICAVYKNSKMCLASGKRAIKNGIVHNNFNKILMLRPKIYYAITGTAEAGLWFFDRLGEMSGSSDLDVKELLEWIEKDFPIHGFPKVAIVLAGKDEENNFFIFTIDSEGTINRPVITGENLAYAVSANNNIPLFSRYFGNMLKRSPSIESAMSATIQYASTVDHSISKKFDIVSVD
jgi:hypothetical protein